MSTKTVSIESKFLNKMLIILVASISMWSLVWVHTEYSNFKSQSAVLRSNHLKTQKTMIKNEVDRAMKHITEMNSLSELRLQRLLKERVYEAHAIATHIYREDSKTGNLSDVRESIKKALRPIRFFDGRGYFFAVSMDGIEQLYPVKPELEGKNVLGLQDAQGHFVIREEIKLIQASGEGFVKHYWNKPGEKVSQAQLKTSFIKFFEPLNWYIGTGEYIDETRKATQSHVLEYLIRLRFGNDGYFFGSTFDGESLFSNGKITINGGNIWDLTDPNGVKIIQEQSQAAQNNDGGFVRYSWRKLQSNYPSPKISYVKGVPEWQWTIGAGVYLDTIESEIAERKNILLAKLKQDIIRSIVLFLLLFCLTLFWHRRMSKQLRMSVNSLLSFLQKAHTDSVRIDLDSLQLKEFNAIAQSANQMLDDRVEAETLLKKSEKKYRLLVENASELVVVAQDGMIRFINGQSLNFIGYQPEEVIGKPMTEFIHPDDRKTVMDRHYKRLNGSRDIPDLYSFRLVDRNGNEKWIDLHAVKIDWEDNFATLNLISDITERKQAEQLLKESEIRFKALHNASFGGIAIHDKGIILECNQGLSEMTGYATEELIGMDGLLLIAAGSREKVMENIQSGYEKSYEVVGIRKNQEEYPLRLEARKIPYKGKPVRVVEFRDISEIKQAEKERDMIQTQLTQARKMEAVGRLAGGVAHDFNNMLSIILGNLEIILEDFDSQSPLVSNLKEVQKAAQRSTHLTRQLLAFARKQTISPKILNLNTAIEGMLKMLSRLIGEDIHLLWHPAKSLDFVKIDPSQVDQMLANVCVNARDAIKDVGKVTIETSNAQFDQAYCNDHPGFKPGDYVMIGISDNGCGMDKETINNLFEPFFTTKKVGEGTGLGLATVYGIVKQNNGFINVYSEPGTGTTLKIYLPRHTGNAAAQVQPLGRERILKGSETILLVEDEAAILKMTKMMLERLGYTVLPANTPDAAMRLCETVTSEIHLLITDVVMPSMNGRNLAEKIIRRFPKIKCLYMSGYTANVIAHRGVLDEGVNFINKPFSKQELSVRLRDILDE